MEIGKPQRVIVVEPIERPVEKPAPKPEPVREPEEGARVTDEKLREGIQALLNEYGYLGVGKAWIEAMPVGRRVSIISTVMQLRLDDGSHVPNRLLADDMRRWEQ